MRIVREFEFENPCSRKSQALATGCQIIHNTERNTFAFRDENGQPLVFVEMKDGEPLRRFEELPVGPRPTLMLALISSLSGFRLNEELFVEPDPLERVYRAVARIDGDAHGTVEQIVHQPPVQPATAKVA